jgi:hypothetical protein
MPTSTFARFVAVVLAGMLVFILGLSYVLFNNGPRVRIVGFDAQPDETSLTAGTRLTIRFDRPLTEGDYTDQIRFTPEVAFSAQTNSQTILVTLEENFQHDTEYTLEVGTEIFDQTNKKMKHLYSETFATSPPRYAYIDRSDSEDDTVWLGRLGEQPERVFSHPQVVSMVANNSYVVVSVREESEDVLHVIDLATDEVREVQTTLLDGRISNLTISEQGDVALYTVTPDFNLVSREYYDRFANRLETLHLDLARGRTLTDSDGEYIRAYSVHIDRNGQAGLIQDASQTYFAVSPYDDYDPVQIGTRTASFGFSNDASEIIFRDNETFSIFDIASGENNEIEVPTPGFVQQIRSTSGSEYISSSSYFAGDSSAAIQRLAEWGDADPATVWTSEDIDDAVLRDFSVSYDESLIALQLNPSRCTFDALAPNAQCDGVFTVLYDVDTQAELETIEGFDLVWLP